MDFDATSIYPKAMTKMFIQKLKVAIFTFDMDDELVEKFSSGNFIQDGALLKAKNYISPDLIFQQLHVKERVNEIEVNRMRNAYNIDTLTSVDVMGIIRIEGKLVEIY